MPIYEYRCAACGHHLEALQKMTEGPLRKCPDCGKLKLRRLISASRFRLKGSGWYETDFKGDAEKKRNLVERAGTEAADGGAKGDDKKEVPAAEAPAPAAADKETTKPQQPETKPAAASKKPANKGRAAKSARA
jgi:putative FmdB family regulatory protein